MRSLADLVDAHAARRPDAPAFLGTQELSWSGYARCSSRLAGVLCALGIEPGERVATWLPDGPGVHVAFLANEKAGCITLGIGPRAGREEARHLLARSGAVALVSRARHGEIDLEEWVATLRSEGLPLRNHLVIEGEASEEEPIRVDGREVEPALGRDPLEALLRERRLGPGDVFLLNSTSGTTGLPKIVVHDQQRWLYFHELARASGELDERDVFLSALPAPFGFGIWTAHVTPAILGAPVVLSPRFDAGETLRAIERHRVTVLAAVTTQFIMLLESPALERCDLASLRALFTGGEAVPIERSREFERRTGALVLQFYGSNETGALSGTSTRDPESVRLGTAGRVIEGMRVRLFDADGRDVTASGRGQPGCRGPATSRGYWDDPEANAKLHTPDGWMLTGDIATLDSDGVLRVVGRTADFIIRGGKNISGPAVEEAVASHPSVALAAAVAMPDRVFGERVCVYAQLRPGRSLTLPELTAHLEARGASKETLPERLEVVDELPRASGGKIAKQRLREDIRERLAREGA